MSSSSAAAAVLHLLGRRQNVPPFHHPLQPPRPATRALTIFSTLPGPSSSSTGDDEDASVRRRGFVARPRGNLQHRAKLSRQVTTPSSPLRYLCSSRKFKEVIYYLREAPPSDGRSSNVQQRRLRSRGVRSKRSRTAWRLERETLIQEYSNAFRGRKVVSGEMTLCVR